MSSPSFTFLATRLSFVYTGFAIGVTLSVVGTPPTRSKCDVIDFGSGFGCTCDCTSSVLRIATHRPSQLLEIIPSARYSVDAVPKS